MISLEINFPRVRNKLPKTFFETLIETGDAIYLGVEFDIGVPGVPIEVEGSYVQHLVIHESPLGVQQVLIVGVNRNARLVQSLKESLVLQEIVNFNVSQIRRHYLNLHSALFCSDELLFHFVQSIEIGTKNSDRA